MDMRFPKSTPRVSQSAVLYPKEVALIDGAQFEDGLRRLVVGPEISEDTMAALTQVLSEIDNRDAAVRWMTDLLANHVNGSSS